MRTTVREVLGESLLPSSSQLPEAARIPRFALLTPDPCPFSRLLKTSSMELSLTPASTVTSPPSASGPPAALICDDWSRLSTWLNQEIYMVLKYTCVCAYGPVFREDFMKARDRNWKDRFRDRILVFG